MESTLRRAGIGGLVVVAAVGASLVTKIDGGAAATSARTVTQVNVTVYLHGSSKDYTNVKNVRFYPGSDQLKIVSQDGSSRSFARNKVVSYTTSYEQTTSAPTPTPSSSTGVPTTSPTATTTTSPTATSTMTPVLPPPLTTH